MNKITENVYNRLAKTTKLANNIAKTIAAGVSVGIGDESYWKKQVEKKNEFKKLGDYFKQHFSLIAKVEFQQSVYGEMFIFTPEEPELLNDVIDLAHKLAWQLNNNKGINVRIDVEDNTVTATYDNSDLLSTSLTYTTWKMILDKLGLSEMDEEGGELEIDEFIKLFNKNPVMNNLAKQIYRQMKEAKQNGYKTMSWA